MKIISGTKEFADLLKAKNQLTKIIKEAKAQNGQWDVEASTLVALEKLSKGQEVSGDDMIKQTIIDLSKNILSEGRYD